MPLLLANAVATNGSGDPVTISSRIRREAPERTLQVSISGTITIDVEGRMTSSAPWVSVFTAAASVAAKVPLFPEMRVTRSGVASTPSASVWLDAEPT